MFITIEYALDNTSRVVVAILDRFRIELALSNDTSGKRWGIKNLLIVLSDKVSWYVFTLRCGICMSLLYGSILVSFDTWLLYVVK